MSTRLGYDFAPIDVSIMTHPKACAAGPEAMGLWLWGQAYARVQKSGGRIHRHAALVAWGGKRNIILAKRLVEAGLWLAREDGDWDVHNFEAKAGPARSSSAKRMRDLRDRRKQELSLVTPSDVTECHGDAHGDALCSPSLSTSPSGSSSGGAGGASVWWPAAIATAEQETSLTVDQPGARWVEYSAARERKGWAKNQQDAASWLIAVLRREHREAPRSKGGGGPRGDRQPHDSGWLERMDKTGTGGAF